MKPEDFLKYYMGRPYAEARGRLLKLAQEMDRPALLADVDDCMQEALLLLCTRWDGTKDQERLGGWIYITAQNLLRNRFRVSQSHKNQTESLDGISGAEKEAAMKIEADMNWAAQDDECTQELLKRVQGVLGKEDYRFLLCYMSKRYSAKKLAEMLGVTEASLWMRKKRLIQKIKSLLGLMNFSLLALVLLAPFTFTYRGDDMDAGVSKEDTDAPNTTGPDDELPKLSKQGAQTLLSILEDMPPQDVDMRLVAICLAVLDESAGTSRADVARALRRLKSSLAQRETEQRAVGHHRRVSRKAWVVAAIVSVLLLATAVAYALGWMPWLFSLTHSTEHHDVGITTGDPGAIADDCGFMPTGLSAEFDGLLEKYGLHLPLPTWLPEGLTYDSTDVISDDEVSTDIMGKFYDGRKIVFVQVTKYHLAETAVGIFLEKDDAVYEELVWHG
ncbi:MAG: sigma-70 family RNA polymerase sigma factor, partial [Clostridia bacterium]